MRRREIAIRLPSSCSFDEAYMIVAAAQNRSHRPERMVIVEGTEVTNTPYPAMVGDDVTDEYRNVTLKSGARLFRVPVVTDIEAARLQAEWDQHDAFVSQMGHSWNGLV